MRLVLQQSLLDPVGEPERITLSSGAWIDVAPGWLAGADDLFFRLVERMEWRAERRPMFDRVVDVPRLVAHIGEGDALPDPALGRIRRDLDRRYAPEMGEGFATIGLCLYRDGRDGVAWHGDTIGRGSSEDTVVAIVSLGAPRPLLLRPRDRSGPTLRHDAGHGHLLVMGGSCQRTWEHAVTKTTRAVEPRISLQYRAIGVR